MTIEGEQTLPVGAEDLWHRLMDPDFLAVVIPGCRKLEQIDDRNYAGTIAAKLGPIESRYATDFTISETDFPNSFRLQVLGQGAGGFVKSDLQFRLTELDGDATRLQYSGETSVGGRLAAVGQRLIKAAAGMMIRKGLNDLRSRMEELEGSDAAPSPHPDDDRSNEQHKER